MNITSVEKATKLIEEIKSLDKQISEIDKFAQSVMEDPFKISVEINVGENKACKSTRVNPFSALEEFREAVRNFNYDVERVNFFGEYKNKEDDQKKSFAQEIPLHVFGKFMDVLITEKQLQRISLLSKLEKLGITI